MSGGAKVRTALLDVAGELLTSQEVGALPELTPAAVAEAIGDHFLTLAADNGRDGYAKGRRDTEKDIAAGLLNGQEYQDWSKGEPGPGPLLSALRQHYSTLLTSQSHGAYGSGYRKAQADAATPPEPIRITGGGVKLTNVRVGSSSGVHDPQSAFDRGRWAGSNEAAASVARQLYGAAGAHVANAADLIALVRSEQDRRLDPWQGPGEPGPWAKRAEQVRDDTLRAVASWLSQNWGVRLDSNPEWLTTPEALGARITSATAERVARATAHTYTEAEIHNAETRRETRVCRHLLTAVGAPVPDDETENLVREDVAAVLRKQIDEQARERVSRLRTVGINEGRHAMARFVLRGLNHPDKAELDPEQSVSKQVASELQKAFAHARWRTLQEVVRQLGGGDAGEEPVNTVQDVVEFVRRRVADEACSVAYRIIRRSLGFMAGREVAAAGADPEKCITVAGDAVRAELATARDERVRVVRKVSIALFGALLPGQDADNEDALIERLRSAVRYSDEQRTTQGYSSANARYAELRRRYSAEHDAAHHTRAEFSDAAIALLLGSSRYVGSAENIDGGTRTRTEKYPSALWPFGRDTWPVNRATVVIEAAALLMCALDHDDE